MKPEDIDKILEDRQVIAEAAQRGLIMPEELDALNAAGGDATNLDVQALATHGKALADRAVSRRVHQMRGEQAGETAAFATGYADSFVARTMDYLGVVAKGIGLDLGMSASEGTQQSASTLGSVVGKILKGKWDQLLGLPDDPVERQAYYSANPTSSMLGQIGGTLTMDIIGVAATGGTGGFGSASMMNRIAAFPKLTLLASGGAGVLGWNYGHLLSPDHAEDPTAQERFSNAAAAFGGTFFGMSMLLGRPLPGHVAEVLAQGQKAKLGYVGIGKLLSTRPRLTTGHMVGGAVAGALFGAAEAQREGMDQGEALFYTAQQALGFAAFDIGLAGIGGSTRWAAINTIGAQRVAKAVAEHPVMYGSAMAALGAGAGAGIGALYDYEGTGAVAGGATGLFVLAPQLRRLALNRSLVGDDVVRAITEGKWGQISGKDRNFLVRSLMTDELKAAVDQQAANDIAQAVARGEANMAADAAARAQVMKQHVHEALGLSADPADMELVKRLYDAEASLVQMMPSGVIPPQALSNPAYVQQVMGLHAMIAEARAVLGKRAKDRGVAALAQPGTGTAALDVLDAAVKRTTATPKALTTGLGVETLSGKVDDVALQRWSKNLDEWVVAREKALTMEREQAVAEVADRAALAKTREAVVGRVLPAGGRTIKNLIPETVTPSTASGATLHVNRVREFFQSLGLRLEIAAGAPGATNTWRIVNEAGVEQAAHVSLSGLLRGRPEWQRAYASFVKERGATSGETAFTMALSALGSLGGGFAGDYMQDWLYNNTELDIDPESNMGTLAGFLGGAVLGGAFGIGATSLAAARNSMLKHGLKLRIVPEEQLLTHEQAREHIGKAATGRGTFVKMSLADQAAHLEKRLENVLNRQYEDGERKVKSIYSVINSFATISPENYDRIRNIVYNALDKMTIDRQPINEAQKATIWRGFLVRAAQQPQDRIFTSRERLLALGRRGFELEGAVSEDKLRSLVAAAEVVTGPTVDLTRAQKANELLTLNRQLIPEAKHLKALAEAEAHWSAKSTVAGVTSGETLGGPFRAFRAPLEFVRSQVEALRQHTSEAAQNLAAILGKWVDDAANTDRASKAQMDIWRTRVLDVFHGFSPAQRLILRDIIEDPVKFADAQVNNPLMHSRAIQFRELATEIRKQLGFDEIAEDIALVGEALNTLKRTPNEGEISNWIRENAPRHKPENARAMALKELGKKPSSTDIRAWVETNRNKKLDLKDIDHYTPFARPDYTLDDLMRGLGVERVDSWFHIVYNQHSIRSLMRKQNVPYAYLVPPDIGVPNAKLLNAMRRRTTDGLKYERLDPLEEALIYVGGAARKIHWDMYLARYDGDFFHRVAKDYAQPQLAAHMLRWTTDGLGLMNAERANALAWFQRLGLRIEDAAKMGFQGHVPEFLDEFVQRYMLDTNAPTNVAYGARGWSAMTKLGGASLSSLVNLGGIITNLAVDGQFLDIFTHGIPSATQAARGALATRFPRLMPFIDPNASGIAKYNLMREYGVFSDTTRRYIEEMGVLEFQRKGRSFGVTTVAAGLGAVGGGAVSAARGTEDENTTAVGDVSLGPFTRGAVSGGLGGAAAALAAPLAVRRVLSMAVRGWMLPFTAAENTGRALAFGTGQATARRGLALAAEPAKRGTARALQTVDSALLGAAAIGGASAVGAEEGYRGEAFLKGAVAGAIAGGVAGLGRGATELAAKEFEWKRAIEKGKQISDAELMEWYTTTFIDRNLFRYSRIMRPEKLRTPMGEVIGALQTWSINQGEYMWQRYAAFTRSAVDAGQSGNFAQLDTRIFRYMLGLTAVASVMSAMSIAADSDRDNPYWAYRLGLGMLPFIAYNESAEKWNVVDPTRVFAGPFLGDVKRVFTTLVNLSDERRREQFFEEIDELAQGIVASAKQMELAPERIGAALDTLRMESAAEKVRATEDFMNALAHPATALTTTPAPAPGSRYQPPGQQGGSSPFGGSFGGGGFGGGGFGRR